MQPCGHCGAALPPGAILCGACGVRVGAPVHRPEPPGPPSEAPPRPAPVQPLLPVPELVADPPQSSPPAPAAEAPVRFILQFSTGESFAVTGTGLIGRHPVAEPGEYFDHAVTIADPGKSVSKTHAEFGQEDGMFWVLDRFSGNGTAVREPGEEPRYCEPGRRYRVSRGGRVDIGDQFFIVS